MILMKRSRIGHAGYWDGDKFVVTSADEFTLPVVRRIWFWQKRRFLRRGWSISLTWLGWLDYFFRLIRPSAHRGRRIRVRR